MALQPEEKIYTFRIPALRGYHASMREAGLKASVFDVTFENVTCSAVFRTDTTLYSIALVKRATGEVISFDVGRGYCALMPASLQDDVRRFFEVPYGRRGFRPLLKELATAVNLHVPERCAPKLANRDRSAISSAAKVEDAKKIFFYGLEHWDKPDASQTSRAVKKHRTRANIEKTELLYPEINRAIAGLNISVCYTDDPDKAKHWDGSLR